MKKLVNKRVFGFLSPKFDRVKNKVSGKIESFSSGLKRNKFFFSQILLQLQLLLSAAFFSVESS